VTKTPLRVASIALAAQIACIAIAPAPIDAASLQRRAAGQPTTGFARSEEREPCANYRPLRTPFFGDLHVHTALSQDAATQGTRTSPVQAYDFARGKLLGIQPFNEHGEPKRSMQLKRPLDFAAVTDHAEFLGELEICKTPGLPGHDSFLCMMQRNFPRAAFFVMNTLGPFRSSPTRFGMCGKNATHCLDAAAGAWGLIRDAAEQAYDRTAACTFTSFVGYEWTASTDSNNLHRNVIFRNDVVPELPTSYFEAPRPELLHAALEQQCLDNESGCDVVIVPHNSNLSGGLMFEINDGEDLDPAKAARRSELEPLVEIIQHKGASECLPGGFAADEECGFELLPYSNFAGKYFQPLRWPPERRGFVRPTLGRGLSIERNIGANPFRFGLIGSTDTHLGAAGAISESDYPGHGGAGVPAANEVPPGLPDDVEFNPGGLAVLWAEENSRDALFQAMRRREAYATSGPRMVVRFFGGWELPNNLCESHSFAETGYGSGVPMGGILAPAPKQDTAGPDFAVWALADATSESRAGLERIQIIKGWTNGAASDQPGAYSEKVFNLASAPNAPFSMNENQCIVEESAAQELCRVWRDPDFDPSEPAYYYVRVLEQPTCRWSQQICNAKGVRCDQPETISEGLEPCCADEHVATIRERAWTSPIWYTPPATK
jgi:hypothetical protein